MTKLTKDAAADILSHLLNTLEYPPQERHRRRYSSLVSGNEKALQEYLFSCIQPEVFETFNQSALPSWASLRKLNEKKAPPADTAGVYVNIIRGTDGYDRMYVGQTGRLSQRIKQHMNFRYRRDNKSLHYHAVEHSSWNNFIILATTPPPSGSQPAWLRGNGLELVLNILEMWCALMFRTLPRSTLEDWLPEKTLTNGNVQWYGLNLALPLDQGVPESTPREDFGAAMRSSPDPLARNYANGAGYMPKAIPHPAQPDAASVTDQPALAASTVALFAFAVGFFAGSLWAKK
ncbi:hypothetical protein Micbo1qcDRAFT_166318 [Microdochium bolleyi]|uniref:GIY-YIG domain-containing protein n=1 Tax=Microdochium bolleyi TaxID=196109 RepID=A0A136IVG6_9PEZI|nr:hypothetical protein Micbo1qcDRAFT_166318 [Microdochium bolleyi]